MSEPALTVPRRAAALMAGLAKRPRAALVLLCLALWLPGFASLPVLDRDEARFAQSAKQMVQTGNAIDIRFGTQPRYKKPVGIYWLQAASTKLLGQPPYNAIWTYRIPSLLGAIAAVLLAFWCLSAIAPPLSAFMGAALLALTLGLSTEAHIAKTDAVLLATILAAQGVLLRVYLAARDKARDPPDFMLVMAGWAALAAGVLVKGPVILAVLALTAIAVSLWDRNLRWLSGTRPLTGILLFLALALPWFVAIGFESHGAFYAQALGHDFAGKLVGAQESHGAPPGYYIALATVTLWPASLFALPGIGAAVTARKEAAPRFLLSWAGASWLMFALVPTKLPHYILPVYPALCFMAALWFTREQDETRAQKWLVAIACFQFAIGTMALAATIVLVPQEFGGGMQWWLITAAALGGYIALGGAVLLFLRKPVMAFLMAALGALILYPTLMWGVAPQLTKIWVSPRLAAAVAKDSRPGDPPVVTAGYDEPSLIFLLGTGTRIAKGADAARIAASQGGLVLADEKQTPAFLATLKTKGAKAHALDEIDGINYSRGQPVHITLYRVTPTK